MQAIVFLRPLAVFFSLGLIVLFSRTEASEVSAQPKDRAIALAFAEAQAETEAEAAPADAEAGSVPEFRQKLERAVTLGQEDEFPLEADSFFRYVPVSSAHDQAGKVGITHSASEFSYTYKAFGQLPIEFSLNGEYIDANANDALVVSLPSHLTATEFAVQATVPFFNINNTYLRVKLQPGFYSDNWNFRPNSFRLDNYTYLIYQPDEKWVFVCGVGSSPGTEDPVFPIAGVIYKPNEKLAFNIIPSTPNISYAINKCATVFVNGGFSSNEYKVLKDGYRGAALQYNEIHAGGGIKLSINKYLDAYLGSGYMFNRYLKYRDSLGKVNLENNIYSEFRIEARI